MFGLIVPILITIHVYRNAKENGRSAPLWAIINLAVIFGVQILIGFTIGLGFGLGSAFLDWEEGLFEKYVVLINLIAFVASLLCAYFFVVRTVTRVPDEQFDAPPPPPQFN